MDRRSFLRTTLVTAGGVALGACGDDDDPVADTGVDAGGGDADVTPDSMGDATPDAGPTYESGEAFFPQSLASGDPKDSSVILWTRVEDEASSDADVDLVLHVALDEAFTSRIDLDGSPDLTVTAEAAFDHCVKIRLTNLDSATTYYYRFIHTSDDVEYASNTGRTKTAPAPDADVDVTFAFVSCQDYNGRYYNSYKQLLTMEVDFVVHLGDYVYETTGDPGFQTTTGRRVVFSDTEGAIGFHVGTEEEYFAAKSLSNYRELYKTYRSDSELQKVHELYPMICIWDDHEFSDDSHGASGTYFDGAADELDVDRKQNANKAWFEYMPVDYRDGDDFRYDPEVSFPDDMTIYRDIEYGANLHLVMTDLRTYRADHVVPEDVFPGTVALTSEELTSMVGAVPESAPGYVDIATFQDGLYQTILQGAAEAAEYDAANVTGLISVDFINQVVTGVNEADPDGDQIPLLEGDAIADLPRGFAFMHFLKIDQYGQLGSRYLCIKDTWALYAAKRWAETSGASEAAMGDDQEAWFLDTIEDSTKTWKVWGNEFCLIPKAVDLTAIDFLPAVFQQKFILSAEDWDGMPNRRDLLLTRLAEVDNVVAITGDIHAFFAGTPWVSTDNSKKIVEFVTSAISSGTYQELLTRTAVSNPTLRDAGAAGLAAGAGQFLTDSIARPNPNLGYADIASHGFSIVRVSASTMEVEHHAIASRFATRDMDPGELAEEFEVERFKVDAGSSELHRMIDDEWKRWDAEEFDWV